MSTGDQPTVRREWSYSRGWRLFSQIILHPGLRALIRFKWSGRDNIPKTGGLILAPNHMSYADWPAIALFSDGYARRYPVFMIKSGIFEVKVVGWLLYKFGQLPVYRGRGDAGLVLKQAERALRNGDAVIVYPEGTATRDPDLWPMVGKTGAARLALTTGAGDPDRAVGGAAHPPLRHQEGTPVAAQDGPDGRRAPGGPVGVGRPAARRLDAAGRHGRHHG